MNFNGKGRDDGCFRLGTVRALRDDVDASSSHDAVRKAVAFFLDPSGRGRSRRRGRFRGCPDWGKETQALVVHVSR
jgi:hypothetical protein